jgi:hypothetical protein
MKEMGDEPRLKPPVTPPVVAGGKVVPFPGRR